MPVFIWMKLRQLQLPYNFISLTQIEVSKIDFIEVVNWENFVELREYVECVLKLVYVHGSTQCKQKENAFQKVLKII